MLGGSNKLFHELLFLAGRSSQLRQCRQSIFEFADAALQPVFGFERNLHFMQRSRNAERYGVVITASIVVF